MGELEYKVRRGNVSLRVTKQEADKYFDMGYSVYTLDGKLIKQAVPKDIPTLQKAFLDDKAHIAKLEAKIAELTEQLEGKPKASIRKTTKKSED